MHYDTDYTGLELQAKVDKALEDIKFYLGGEKAFESLSQQLRKDAEEEHRVVTLREFHIIASFAGVQGYPATAWYQYLWPKEMERMG